MRRLSASCGRRWTCLRSGTTWWKRKVRQATDPSPKPSPQGRGDVLGLPPMEQRHLLLINQYFPPDTSATARMAALVAGALAKRHRVTVLCGRPSYDPTEHHPYYLARREVRDGLVVERVGSTALSRYRMRGRIFNYLSFLALAVPRALAIRADAVVVMTDPPGLGVVGAFIAALKRVPFIYNIRDLHPDMAVHDGLVKAGPLSAECEGLHRVGLRKAHR